METTVVQLVLTGICITLVTGVSTIGNISVILVFARTKHLRTVSNYFFLSLTFGDLIVGLCYPFQCLVNLGVVVQRPACLTAICILLVIALIVIWSLLALTVERYLAITRPLTARSIISETRAIQIIIVIFISAAISGGVIPVLLSMTRTQKTANADDMEFGCRFSTLVPYSGYRLFIVFCRITSVLVFLPVYVKIFFVVRRHMRIIAAQATPAPAVATSSSVPRQSLTSTGQIKGTDQRNPWTRKVSSTALLFTIVTYHSLSWIPLTIINARSSETQDYGLVTLVHFITYSSAALNPVIYGLGNRDIRIAFVSLFRRNRREASIGV